MKYIVIIFLCLFAFIVNAEKLMTPTYEILIEWKCGEGHVSCSNIEFQVRNKKEGMVGKYIGKSNHSKCADGVTPCKFQGYEFRMGNLNYIIYMRGHIQATKNNNEVVLSEDGVWR